MEKIKTTVKIAGREYTIVGYDPEDHVRRVARHVDQSMSELETATHLPNAQLAVLAAVNATDGMVKAREEARKLRRENEELRAALEEARRGR